MTTDSTPTSTFTRRAGRLPSWAWVLIAIIALAKLVLVAHDEIRTFPYDDAGYAAIAAGWYWGNDYNAWSYVRQPGYPLFLAICSALGVPVRLAIELLWLLGASVAARAVVAVSVRPLGGVLVFGLLAIHPNAALVFSRLLADSLYVVVYLAFVVSMGVALGRGSARAMTRWAILAGFAAAVAACTRPESIILFGLLAVGAVSAAALWIMRRAPWELTLRRVGIAVLIPAAMVLASDAALRSANAARIGAWVTYDLSLPGFRDLYRVLVSIPPHAGDPRMPVPRDVRERAAAASPAFATLNQIMDTHERTASFRREGVRQLGVDGEFGAWTFWAIREAAWVQSGDRWSSAREADTYFTAVAAELRAAQDRGELSRRSVPVDWVPPEWGALARAMPAALGAVWQHLTLGRYERRAAEPLPQDDRDRYNAVALRRAGLIGLQLDRHAPGVLLHSPGNVARLDAVKTTIGRALLPFTIMSLTVGTIGAMLGLIAWWRRHLGDAWLFLLVIVWAALVSRVLLVALLHATGIDAQERYTMPAAIMLPLVMVLGMRGIVAWRASRRDQRRSPPQLADVTAAPG